MTADITSGCTITNISPALGIGALKILHIETAATADSGDYITLTLGSTYGTIINIQCCDLTTGAVENATWAPSTGVITLGGATTDKARSLVVIMRRE